MQFTFVYVCKLSAATHVSLIMVRLLALNVLFNLFLALKCDNMSVVFSWKQISYNYDGILCELCLFLFLKRLVGYLKNVLRIIYNGEIELHNM